MPFGTVTTCPVNKTEAYHRLLGLAPTQALLIQHFLYARNILLRLAPGGGILCAFLSSGLSSVQVFARHSVNNKESEILKAKFKLTLALTFAAQNISTAIAACANSSYFVGRQHRDLETGCSRPGQEIMCWPVHTIPSTLIPQVQRPFCSIDDGPSHSQRYSHAQGKFQGEDLWQREVHCQRRTHCLPQGPSRVGLLSNFQGQWQCGLGAIRASDFLQQWGRVSEPSQQRAMEMLCKMQFCLLYRHIIN